MSDNALILADLDPNNLPALQELFGGEDNNEDLSSGVSASFPVLSFKGKVWRVKFKGEERTVLNADGDPVASIAAVLVKASPNVSKIYYEKTYTEGDDAAPTCFSVGGIKPDPGSEKIQSQTCATCPHNVWGSRITENGKKTRACSDSRRVAVVPFPDLDNGGDGPMLLRVPPASLASLVKLRDDLKQVRLPYQAVVVKIGFDNDLAYPKLIFKPIKALDAESAGKVKAIIDSGVLEPMFEEIVDETPAAAEGAPTPQAQKTPQPAPQPEAQPTPQPEAKPAPQPAPQPSPQPAPQPQPQPQTPKEVAADEGVVANSGELDNLLKGVLGD